MLALQYSNSCRTFFLHRREERLRGRREEMRLKVSRDLEEAGREEERRVQLAREEVAEEEADLSGAVLSAAQLDEAISHALDNPADHEFAIDLRGHIYRGRMTKSSDVPPEEREKIPAPPEWRVLELEEQREEGEESASR